MVLEIKFFTSPTCSWCPYIVSVLERILKDAPHLELTIINIIEEIDAAEEHGIVAIPTIILPNNQRIIGAANEAFLYEQLDFFINLGQS